MPGMLHSGILCFLLGHPKTTRELMRLLSSMIDGIDASSLACHYHLRSWKHHELTLCSRGGVEFSVPTLFSDVLRQPFGGSISHSPVFVALVSLDV